MILCTVSMHAWKVATTDAYDNCKNKIDLQDTK